jgi:nucleoside-triphosphatase
MGKAILLTGAPGSGKTTLVRGLLTDLAWSADGFFTQEIRERGIRKGFEIITLGGRRGVLAHVDIRSRYRVSKYGVDLTVLDTLGVGAVEQAVCSGCLVVIDEIGPMEILSDRFRHCVVQALESSAPVLGTIVQRSTPFTDGVKARPEVTVVQVSRDNRDALVQDLAARLRSSLDVVVTSKTTDRIGYCGKA